MSQDEVRRVIEINYVLRYLNLSKQTDAVLSSQAISGAKVGISLHYSAGNCEKTKLRDPSPRGNYTDRATAACHRS
jgi:hypothetical protein